jgi:hypothetical protein
MSSEEGRQIIYRGVIFIVVAFIIKGEKPTLQTITNSSGIQKRKY